MSDKLKKLKSVSFNLTEKQLLVLNDLFKEVTKNNKKGNIGSIIGQVYEDGIICTYLDEDTAMRVIKAIGVTTGEQTSHTFKRY